MGFTTTCSNSDNKTTYGSRLWSRWSRISYLPNKWMTNIVGTTSTAKKIAKDDPRRVVHSFKVGLALTLVSLFYYFQPLYDSFGVSAMWAVITVVVVFEFTVGATLGKGMNRAAATLIAGGLGVGAYYLASLCGKIGEPILIGFFVFIFAATSTFIRFFPKIKARYDYGFLILILTFSLVAISGYRTSEIIELAYQRLSTIAIGGCISLLINTLICPVWAGEELHNSIALNSLKLSHFLEGFGGVYLKSLEGEANNSKDGNKESSAFQGYKSILNSKSTEDSMANFARWEPGHGEFRYHHPWEQYIKLGGLIRQCAYRIDALNAFFNPDLQKAEKLEEEIREACRKISMESSKTLKKVGSSLKDMKHPSPSVNAHIVSSKASVMSLNKAFLIIPSSSSSSSIIHEIIPIATMASLLIDIVDTTEKIAQAAYQLAEFAHFHKSINNNNLQQISNSKIVNNNYQHDDQSARMNNQGYHHNSVGDEVVITVAELALIKDLNSVQTNSNEQRSMASLHQ